ncbi:acetyltransferase, GNAT family [Ancylostoma caninum]|uniref:Acetyltransferase, GNAT family n=1 Tax=Ancylostoma caninum TaxID=29170 RepID=A0A368H871_ANCCA|nr:acetyltransferase, GNAT family [Ancylostoma caninum]
MMDRYTLTPLCQRQDLNRKCIELLNEEWPRSDGSREHSQAKSCRPTPPMSFLFIEKDTDNLTGHARICLLPNRPTSCWIESVIIAKSLRGQGLGKKLMISVEAAAKEFGFNEAFLSTDDQVIFYERCGYSRCDPILHSTTATSVFPVMTKLEEPRVRNHEVHLRKPSDSEVVVGAHPEAPQVVAAAPPPPPPPPPLNNMPSKMSVAPVSTVGHQYMYKKLN